MLMQISTQTNNHKYRKSITTKKVYSLKNGILFQNPKFNIFRRWGGFYAHTRKKKHFMQNNFHFLYEMPTLYSSEVNEAIREQVKVVE